MLPDSMSTLVIVPARAGSKGLPGKHMLPLHGKPMILWTIEYARDSIADDALVLTDSQDVAELALSVDVKVMREPPELAQDGSPIVDAVIWALDELFEREHKTYDVVALLEATAPLRCQSDLDNAFELLYKERFKADAVVSVGRIDNSNVHPYVIKSVSEAGYLQPYMLAPLFSQRQEMPPAYGLYGGIYITKTASLLKRRTFYPERTMPYVVQRWQMFEIDDLTDWMAAAAVFEGRKVWKLQ